MKRCLFSIFLALALCLSLLPAAAFAEGEPALGFYTAAECGAASYVEPGSTVGYYTLPTIGTLWLRSDGSFNTSQLNNDLVASYSQSDDGRTVEIKLNEDKFKGNNSYSLSVSSDGVSVSIHINSGISSSSSISVSDKKSEKYEVGFADLSGDAQTIIHGTWVYRGVTGEPKPENTREFFYSPIVSAAKVVEDENGRHYEFGDGLPVSVEVISMELRPAYSEDTNEDFGETFSFSEDPEAVLATSSVSGNQVSLYRKLGYTGTFVLLAAVEVTVDGAKQSGVVSLPLMAYRIEEATVECGEAYDAEDISAAIDDVVDNLKDHKGTVYVKLKGTRYEGELVLPADMMETKGDYEIRFEADNESGRTAIVGGVNLNNSAASFYSIDFVAPDKAAADGTETRALYGGQAWTDGCTFSGYDVAMDAVGSVTCGMKPNNSVFADNGIAVRVDLDNETGVSLGGDWTGNAFINNDTAVQILSLSPGMSPYYFRIIDNNFVNNDTDFDIQHPGTFYFYRNYYGRVKKNVDDMTSAEILAALEKGSKNIQSQPPTRRIAEHSETKLVTNPRWKDPVDLSGLPSLPTRSAGSGSAVPAVMSLTAAEEPLENYLTADWTLPTEIINGEAELEISAAAFAEASEVDRVISVVEIDAANETSTLLAEWNFGKAAYPDLTGSFDASVTVTEGENGAKTITLKADDDLLAKLQPTLTIPEASGGVKHNGEGVASSSENGSVSFKVSGGGTYEISEANPEIPVEPDIPSNPGTPTTPVEPEKPEAEFTDVVSGAWYVDAVDYVVKNGLMEGTSATTFEPDAHITRAMFWTILARIDGETITGATWATDAREWAMASGVSDGTDPNGRITREQLVTMLWRYLGEPETTGTLAAFTDADSVSDWAAEAMAWAVSEGVIGGVTMTTLVPNGSATRAQCATILMRQA